MPSTYTSLNYHIIFSTKNRAPVLVDEWRERLHEYAGGTVDGLGGIPLAIGGVADHVHLLVALKPTACLADFILDVKRSSSLWVAETAKLTGFHWQDGYAAFTVSASAVKSVRRYIDNQEEHHRRRSFRDELRLLLIKSGVEFDERYLD